MHSFGSYLIKGPKTTQIDLHLHFNLENNLGILFENETTFVLFQTVSRTTLIVLLNSEIMKINSRYSPKPAHGADAARFTEQYLHNEMLIYVSIRRNGEDSVMGFE